MAEREKPLGIEDIFDGSYEEFAALRKEALEALPAEVEQGAQISRPGPEWETLTTDQAIADALLHSAQADGAIDRSLAIDVARRLRDCADTARTQIAQLEKVINSHETTIRNAGEQLAEAKAEAARLRVPQKEEE